MYTHGLKGLIGDAEVGTSAYHPQATTNIGRSDGSGVGGGEEGEI
jgi:hypothetical protein